MLNNLARMFSLMRQESSKIILCLFRLLPRQNIVFSLNCLHTIASFHVLNVVSYVCLLLSLPDWFTAHFTTIYRRWTHKYMVFFLRLFLYRGSCLGVLFFIYNINVIIFSCTVRVKKTLKQWLYYIQQLFLLVTFIFLFSQYLSSKPISSKHSAFYTNVFSDRNPF